jgi:hypothetical protein
MRCSVCNTEAPAEATTCSQCNTALSPPPRRKPRRRGGLDDADTPFSPYIEPPNRPALRAYRLSVYGLVPGAGLLLGPLAVVLALLARHRGKSDPGFTAHAPAKAALLLGSLIGITNWVGLALMLAGLFGS